MHIEWLHVKNVRNLSDLRIEPGPGLNVICGPNGSGKTALLEAIHILGRCRSFRTPGINRVISYRQRELQISAGLRLPDRTQVITGVERSRNRLNIRYNNRTVHKVSEQAALIPVITVTPESHRLVSDSPVYRRRWLDWAMFHVKPDYIQSWKEYHKALKNRNNLLRRKKIDELGAWEQAMWRAAKIMTAQRNAFIRDLSEAMQVTIRKLRIPATTLEYDCGWQTGIDLDLFLAEQRRGDMERGATRQGLHRSDITICQDGRDVGHFYSRGQVKLCIVALSLALDSVFRRSTQRAPVVLVDDLPAELDQTGQQRIIQALAGQEGQVFVTAAGELPPVHHIETTMFHVEQGRIVS